MDVKVSNLIGKEFEDGSITSSLYIKGDVDLSGLDEVDFGNGSLNLFKWKRNDGLAETQISITKQTAGDRWQYSITFAPVSAAYNTITISTGHGVAGSPFEAEGVYINGLGFKKVTAPEELPITEDYINGQVAEKNDINVSETLFTSIFSLGGEFEEMHIPGPAQPGITDLEPETSSEIKEDDKEKYRPYINRVKKFITKYQND